MVKFSIDNKQIEVESGTYLLQAAKKLGIDIPTLCHHPALEPYGACRICLVEITKESWKGWSKLVVSCAYPVENDLIVYTNSEKVIKARKFILELLIARCPESDTIKKLAEKYEVAPASFSLNYEPTDCILCGLCVRVCGELIKQNVISFTHRGSNRKVMTPFNKESDVCITCGACAFVCPTGVIKLEDILGKRKIETWHTELPLYKCKKCGKGFVSTKQLQLLKDKCVSIGDIIELCPECRRKKATEAPICRPVGATEGKGV